MKTQDQPRPAIAGDTTWLFLLAGYVVGFVVAHLLAQRAPIGRKTGSLLGGLGIAMSGRSLGSPWRMDSGARDI